MRESFSPRFSLNNAGPVYDKFRIQRTGNREKKAITNGKASTTSSCPRQLKNQL